MDIELIKTKLLNMKFMKMKYVKIFLLFIAGVIGLTVLTALGGYYYMTRGLPDIDILEDYTPNLTTRVFADDGQMIAEFFIERRIVVPLKRMPEHLKHAFLAAEDSKFYAHEGLDYPGILRAFSKNLKAGRIVQGGSTITQQVAKSFFLSPERTITRKIKEAFMASRIEKHLTKDEILHLYLNQIYFGHGSYGVQAASASYFNKDVSELTVGESALLASLPKAPNRYSPYVNPVGAKRRQEFVLSRMQEEGFLPEQTILEAKSKPLLLKSRTFGNLWVAPYFTEHVRRYIEGAYGNSTLYKGGLNIYTTLNVELQKAANEAVRFGVESHDKRRGYKGPLHYLTTPNEVQAFTDNVEMGFWKTGPLKDTIYHGVIDETQSEDGSYNVKLGARMGNISKRDIAWASLYNPEGTPYGGKKVKLKKILLPGAVIKVKVKRLPAKEDDPIRLTLAQEPQAQAALLAMESRTGNVVAMVGGYDFSKSEYNRAIQAKRQPGSAFKPIIYSAAIDKGYTAATIVLDNPLVFEEKIARETAAEKEVILDEFGEEIVVVLYEESTEYDPIEIDDGPLIKVWRPRNFGEKFYGPTTIREAITKSRNVVTVKVLRDIGVGRAIRNARKLGIESPLARDLSLALGSSSVSLLEITGAFATFANMGNRPRPTFITRIVDKNGIVLEENKPVSVPAISPQTAYITTSLLKGVVEHGTGWRARKLKRPAAGKTGTTNNLNDAWFVGYIPELVAGAWIGYDTEKPLGRNETGSKAAAPIWVSFMRKATKNIPITDFPIPDGVEFAKIDPKTGLLANSQTEEPFFEVFKIGSKPTESAPEKTVTEIPTDFMMFDAGHEEEEETPDTSILKNLLRLDDE
jgi:penicillin-binding protein 1A